jgi:hypothetical protein
MKLQSAIEYLTTYGWAILIISVVLLALFEIVAGAPQVQECIMPAGFSCPSFYLIQNGLLSINLVQATQYPIQVTAIGCVYPIPNGVSGNYVSPIPTANAVFMPVGSNQTFSMYCYTNQTVATSTPIVPWTGAIKSTFSGYLVINYTNAYTHLNNTIYGSVRASATG